MKPTLIVTVVTLLLASLAAVAQEPQDLFCNAGLRPNGYIDCSGLPTAPAFPGGSTHPLP
jgi:hypothetical protein